MFLHLMLSTFAICSCGPKSYVLGEIPSLKDRITMVRQLWDLTQDVLVCSQFYSSFCLITMRFSSTFIFNSLASFIQELLGNSIKVATLA